MDATDLKPGDNCWRIGRADRATFLVDAEAYFAAFKKAAANARHSILIVGWDFHNHTALEWPDSATPGLPNALGEFIETVARRNPSLRVRILIWHAPRLYSPEREWLPQFRYLRRRTRNVRYVLDEAHPVGGSQHQKLIVIDGRMAFVGGLDLSLGRLDSPDHRADDPRRRDPDGDTYGPYHDVQLAADGPLVGDLLDLGRDRWLAATGEGLDVEAADADPWPDDLTPDLRDVDIAIARTLPEWRDRTEVREVERLYRDMFRRAERWVYIENQYLSSAAAAEALSSRLQEDDCPEIVIVLPRDTTGWLEESSMGYLRSRVLARLRDADRHGRLRVYCPVVGDDGDVAVKVHAKLAIVDDRLIRVGSSNLNNRSMGLDAELDLIVDTSSAGEARTGPADLRDRLLGEHLGCGTDAVAEAIDREGSITGAIESLRADRGRTLVDCRAQEIDPPIPVDAELLDPDQPAAPERIADSQVREFDAAPQLRRNLIVTGLVLAALAALGVAWRWGPLADVDVSGQFAGLAAAFDNQWTLAAAVAAAFVLGSLVLAPVVAMIVACGVILDPLPAFAAAFAGSMLAAAAGYGVGRAFGFPLTKRLAGPRIEKVSRALGRHGIVTVVIVRNLPLAPFTLINLAAGASHISFGRFMVGSMIGMSPGILVMTALANRFLAVLTQPDTTNLLLFALAVAAAGLVAVLIWRRFGARRLPGAAR